MNASARSLYGLLTPEKLIATSGLDFMRGLLDGTSPAPPFAEVFDMVITSVEEGRAVFTGNPSRRYYNPMGFVHGGWIALLLDTVMGGAVHSTLPAGIAFSTIEMKTVFLRPLKEEHGPVRAEGGLIHKGAQIASAEGRIYDARDRLVAHGSETCFLRSLAEPEPASTRI